MAVTTELLDALLSPSGGGSGGDPQHTPRAQAEHHLQSLSITDRAAGLLNMLLTLSSSSSPPSPSPTSDPANAARQMLAAVLLRRDVAQLGGNAATGIDAATASSVLTGMVHPLLRLFLDDSTTTKVTKRQVGHCLAELCLSCSILDSATTTTTTSTAQARL